MNRENLLKMIAESGYNLGYGLRIWCKEALCDLRPYRKNARMAGLCLVGCRDLCTFHTAAC